MAGQQWAISADGGFLANTKLSKTLRTATQPMMKLRQFTRVEPGYGKNVSDSLDFDKVSNIQTAGGKITELQDIPESKVLIRKGTLIVDECGNSVPYTGKLEALSEFDPENIVHKALMNDMAKTMDKAVSDELKTGEIIYIPTGPTSQAWDVDGTASTVSTGNFNLFHLKEMVDAANVGIFGSGNVATPIPAFPDGNFVLILSVKAARGLFDDPDYQEAAKFAYPRELFHGEMEEIVYNTRIVVTNNIQALSNGVGGSSALGEGFLIGDDAVIEGMVIKEELRAKLPVKYGRDKGLAWYALEGFKKVWSYATDGEDHIIRLTSG